MLPLCCLSFSLFSVLQPGAYDQWRGEGGIEPPCARPIVNRYFPQLHVLPPLFVETSPYRPASAKVPAIRHMRIIVSIIIFTSSPIVMDDSETEDLISTERSHTLLRIAP